MVVIHGGAEHERDLPQGQQCILLDAAMVRDAGFVSPSISLTAPFLAVGIISAPEYVHRRAVLRHTWLSVHTPTGSPAPAQLDKSGAAGASVLSMFVVRAANAPERLQRRLDAEAQRHDDLLRVTSIPWNETRLRGPVLSLAAWLRFAASRLSLARFVAKVDDDSYLHAPDLAVMLQQVAQELPLSHVYIGSMTWYSWFSKHWDRCGFGWTWRGAENVGQHCRNASWASARCQGLSPGCGPAVGPFPFAAGYLVVLSSSLVSSVAALPALHEELETLRHAQGLVTHKGYQHNQVFEDVWLGSFLHRYVTSTPIAFLQLFRSETVVDLDQTQWGSTVRPSALLVHIRSKEPRIFLAVHDFLHEPEQRTCRRRRFRLACSSGCAAFGVPAEAPAARLCLPSAAEAAGGEGGASSSAMCKLSSELVELPAGSDACKPVDLRRKQGSPRVRALASAIAETVRTGRRQHKKLGEAVATAGRAGRRLDGGGAISDGGGAISDGALGRRLGQMERGGARGGGGRGRGWRSSGGMLQGWVHLAQLKEDGSLDIPSGVHLALEIGANTRNTLDRELLPYDSSLFLLTFEPLLDKYATLLSRNSRPDTRTPLGFHHPRGIALPFAVSSDANAVREFKISGKADSPSPLASPAPATLTQVREFKISGKTDGCASLLSAVSSYYSNDCTNTSGVLERRAVPSVSLEVILGTWLRGRDVSVAKVDAQGLDVGVVRSGGRYLSQLKAVQLEVVRDRPPLKCEPQYAAEPGRASEAKCGVLVRAMDELGDEPDGTN